ncbi:ArsR/SmtB family transcription factor [Auraticoccus monumenti]|uniref:Helix-turn-helix domain-containing protein n=1 Tax=Auraticoccus monumenti TaxID=675864 RepID=A0A1G6V2P5_9ACTN|nr:metalloregulator ArsR/SmtB family transcription factor [Auraticoccus monumenti]SDD47792.1 Helix-turn-helix domain-containing protein [Auraticoccus monumenti]
MSDGLTTVLAALADDTRWAILTRLGRSPASASALAGELPVSRQAVAKHLEVLRGAGLVESRRVGREVVHSCVGNRLSAAAHELELVARDWDARLDRLRSRAEDVAARAADPGPDPDGT